MSINLNSGWRGLWAFKSMRVSLFMLLACVSTAVAQRSTPVQLLHPFGAANDQFGVAVAISGDTMIVGAVLDDVGANADQGSAHIYRWTGSGWAFEASLTAAGGAAGDNLGRSVAISGDTAVVGAYQDDVGANADQGSAYVFTRSGTTWTQQAQLTATGGAASDNFGRSVAIAGDTAVVGAIGDDVDANTDQGSAWAFSRIGSTWIGPDLSLLASDGAAADSFGISVAIDGDTMIVGADGDDIGANSNQGSAYVFTRSGAGGGWTQQAQLTATGGAATDFFGFSVAIAGDTAVVGAYADDVGANLNQGSAYVFTRSGSTWTQQAQLNATGGAASEFFGVSVAISGDTAVVGAEDDDVGANSNQGSAYIFTRTGSTWTQQAQLNAADGAAGDSFGNSVAFSGDTVVVAAYLDDVGANSNQGSAYVFTRSGITWTQQAQLTATGGAAFDFFGISVAISGDTAVVGAYAADVGANTAQGSAYVFTRSGSTWTQQAQLTATDGAASDFFSYSVALSGDTAVVGAYRDDVGANLNQGSAYVFRRSGTVWTQQAQLLATGGAAGDEFGRAVAVSGDTAVVGAASDDVGANISQGSAWTFDVPSNDFSLAHNDVTDISYPTLAAALLPAQSGQQITATEAAWRTVGTLDTLGRSLGLSGSGDVRTPSASTLTLGGSSFLAAPPGSTMDIFGQLRVSAGASADVSADSFLLGSRGILTARTNSSLTINALTANLDGQTRIEQGAALTFAGDAQNIGPVTASQSASVQAGGSITNIDVWSQALNARVSAGGIISNQALWTVTAGEIAAQLFSNRAAFNVFGSTAIFGSFTNEAGAITTIRSGSLFVFGSLTNNGTIVGTLCASCAGTAPNLDVGGSLILGPAANLSMPFVGSLVHVGGSFDCAINSNTRFDLSIATLQLQSIGMAQTLEVMSTDIGADVLGLDRSLAGHYPIGTLEIGPSPSTVRLVDTHDNDNLGQLTCEALYIDTLRINAGSRLINTTCRIYYNTLFNNGTVDVPGNLIPLGQACIGDYNQDGGIDGADVEAFFADWEVAAPGADVNQDGGIDGADVDTFFERWQAGC